MGSGIRGTISVAAYGESRNAANAVTASADVGYSDLTTINTATLFQCPYLVCNRGKW